MKRYLLLLWLVYMVFMASHTFAITREEIIDTAEVYYWVDWTAGYCNTTFWADYYGKLGYSI